VLRGRLLTGRSERFMRHVAGGGDGEGTVAEHALWWPPGKVAGRRLAPYLARRDGAPSAAEAPTDPGVDVQVDLTPELTPA